jgi:hypothetical protein
MGSRPWVAVATSVIGVLFSCGNPERDLGSPAKGEAGTAGEAGGGAPNGAFGGQASGAVGGQSNGDGGDSAGSGGSAGETSGQACKVDADCSDHLACNGIETCVEKVCHAGIAPCPNDDPAHCDAVCVEANGAAVCSVQGQDKDKDGHLSSACMKNVGDDCNDADPTVHAGAPEICDGLDNDCDGKVDLADGLSLSGIATPVSAATGQSRYEPVIAWAPDRSVYGIVYEDKLAGSIYFETIDQAGAQKVEPVAIAPNGSLPGESLAWGGTNFGVAWSTSSGGAFDNRYSNGTVGAAPKQPTGAFGPTQVAYSGDGTSATLYHQVAAGGTTTAFLHGPAGFSTTTILGDDTNVSMVGTATGFVVGAVDTGVGRVVLFNSTFTMDLPEGLMGGVPVVAAGSNRFRNRRYLGDRSTALLLLRRWRRRAVQLGKIRRQVLHPRVDDSHLARLPRGVLRRSPRSGGVHRLHSRSLIYGGFGPRHERRHRRKCGGLWRRLARHRQCGSQIAPLRSQLLRLIGYWKTKVCTACAGIVPSAACVPKPIE